MDRVAIGVFQEEMSTCVTAAMLLRVSRLDAEKGLPETLRLLTIYTQTYHTLHTVL